MREGLTALCLPFGYTTTWIVGYLETIQGDEYILKNARRIKSIGNDTPEDRIENGCTNEELTKPADRFIHRLQVLQAIIPGKTWETLIKKPE